MPPKVKNLEVRKTQLKSMEADNPVRFVFICAGFFEFCARSVLWGYRAQPANAVPEGVCTVRGVLGVKYVFST